MKATIEYNLPDEQYIYDTAANSMKLEAALDNIRDLLQRITKGWESETLYNEPLFDKIYDILEEAYRWREL